MTPAVLAVGLLLTATGAWSLAAPEQAQRLLQRFMAARLYSLSIVLRMLFGLILLFGARSTRVPEVAIALGVLFLLAAALIPLLGEDRIGRILRWWLAKPAVWLQGWAAGVLAIGLCILWLTS